MDIVFDPAKDASNIDKHGVSLAWSSELLWETLQAKLDDRRDYREQRFIGYALMADRLYCVVYTDRGNTRRTIKEYCIMLRPCAKRAIFRSQLGAKAEFINREFCIT